MVVRVLFTKGRPPRLVNAVLKTLVETKTVILNPLISQMYPHDGDTRGGRSGRGVPDRVPTDPVQRVPTTPSLPLSSTDVGPPNNPTEHSGPRRDIGTQWYRFKSRPKSVSCPPVSPVSVRRPEIGSDRDRSTTGSRLGPVGPDSTVSVYLVTRVHDPCCPAPVLGY